MYSFFPVNCWPSENGEGDCDVNIEYELEQENLELNDVQINIPLPMGSTLVVGECDGQYTHEARRNMLVWSLPLIDASTKSGSMEFSVQSATPADFFPLQISFSSKTPYANIKVKIIILFLSPLPRKGSTTEKIYDLFILQVNEVLMVEDDSPVKHSVDTVFFTENYEIV